MVRRYVIEQSFSNILWDSKKYTRQSRYWHFAYHLWVMVKVDGFYSLQSIWGILRVFVDDYDGEDYVGKNCVERL